MMLRLKCFSILLTVVLLNKGVAGENGEASPLQLETFFYNNQDITRLIEQVDVLNVKLDRFNEKVEEVICSRQSNNSQNNCDNIHFNQNVNRHINDYINRNTNINQNSIGDIVKKTKVRILPKSCAEALQTGHESVSLNTDHSGIYQLYIPDSDLKPFYVYCLQDENEYGSAWTVIQRRSDNSTNFYRNWNDYEEGFGNLENEHFLGLRKLHALTAWEKYELWIKLEDFDNNTKSAYYDSFAIDDATSEYTLNVLGKYHGDAGDSLSRQQGQKFTTKDRDNDMSSTVNCAVHNKGAWWYEKCLDSNLNGVRHTGDYKAAAAEGIVWTTWHDIWYSLKYVHMAIRPIQ